MFRWCGSATQSGISESEKVQRTIATWCLITTRLYLINRKQQSSEVSWYLQSSQVLKAKNLLVKSIFHILEYVKIQVWC